MYKWQHIISSTAAEAWYHNSLFPGNSNTKKCSRKKH